MALSATIHRFAVDLSNVDRAVYESLDVRAARHPSESPRFLLTRVLAYSAEHAEGIEFGRGVSTADEPAVWIKDATGTVTDWIEVGSPSVDRLHRASKTGARVSVYSHKEPDTLMEELGRSRIHRQDELRIFVVPATVLDPLEQRLQRHERWSLTIAEGHVYLTRAEEAFEGILRRVPAP